MDIGSSLSIRAFARLGASFSLFGKSMMGSGLSVFDMVPVGSVLSLRSFARMGSSFSLFGTARLGSSYSLFGFTSFGSSMSLRGFCRLGSSLSLFASARFGSGLSVLDYVSLGSSMSVGSIKTARIGDGAEPFGSEGTRIDFLYRAPVPSAPQPPAPGPEMNFYIGQAHTMSMKRTVSILHGIWESDATITTSDRRLKTSIEPLYRTIAARAKARWSETRTDPAPGETRLTLRGNAQSSEQTLATTPQSKQQQDPPIGWLLRELRPVSFKLKSGPEAKYLKFGFIAQELETIFPNLVRNVGGEPGSEEGTKAIASQDLIAVLTLALQNLQKEMDKQRDYMLREIEDQRRQLATLIAENRLRLDRIERAVFATQV